MGRNRYLQLKFYGSGPESPSLAFVCSIASSYLEVFDSIALAEHRVDQHAKSLNIKERTRVHAKFHTPQMGWIYSSQDSDRPFAEAFTMDPRVWSKGLRAIP